MFVCVWSRIGRTEMAIELFGVNSFKYFEGFYEMNKVIFLF